MLKRASMFGTGLILALALSTAPAFGEDAPDFDRALVLQDQGKIAEAIDLYEKGVEAGLVNGHLYYNLGHAYFRAGRLGDAMAAFLAARRYLPRDPDVRANLKFVQGKIGDRLEAQAESAGLARILGFWVTKATPREYAWLTAWCGLLSGVALSLCLLVPRLAPFRGWAWASLALPVLGLAHLLACLSLTQVWGATTVAKTAVHSGPSRSDKTLFELREGAPFQVTGRTGTWYRIVLSDGKVGWLPADEGRVLGM